MQDNHEREEFREWLEDSRTGHFSRYAKETEESTWICNECGAEDADPWENGCCECEVGADAY
jgi:rubrerythrin